MHMFKQLIQEVFHTEDYKIEKMNKGLTNHNYMLKVNGKQYVVRVPGENHAGINRNNEKKVAALAASLDVETIYFDVKNGIKITRYIPDLYEYEECPYPDKIERCARLMKKLHKLPVTDVSFDAFQTLKQYQSHVGKPLYDLSMYESKIEAVKYFKNQKVLCHNDFVSGNILFGETRDYLIDYEYGGCNDALFDVISFLSENQIFDKNLRQRFYQEYFGTLDENTKQQLYLWEMFQNVLWCNWAMMMYETRKEEVYQEIAKDKYEALLHLDEVYQ